MSRFRYAKQQFLQKGYPEALRRKLLSLEERRIAASPFFTRYPYQGAMNLRDVDLRCVVIPEHKVLYHRIPKNGNSSLVSTMLNIFEGGELAERIEDKRYSKKVVQNVSELTRAQVDDLGAFTKFLIARNPYDRTLSAYLSKVVKRYPKLKPEHPLKRDAGGDAGGTGPPDFEGFCRYLAKGGLYVDHHWSPQHDYLVLPIADYDFVARLETIDADFPPIVARIAPWRDAKTLVREDAPHRTSAASKRAQFYTDASYAIVAELFARDFEVFGYDPRDR
ncbi:MAG: sulfotransferase family 2 domain-containing protein [Rhizobiales bacterium]|nr:sulfotransferase family 2 domain-containing protein [Hyphomicrobiales bacterium]